MPEEAVKEIKVDRKHRKIGNIAPELADRCYTCGTCAGGCPATGLVPGWDPRKAIRALSWEWSRRSLIPSGPGFAPCAAAASTSAPWASS